MVILTLVTNYSLVEGEKTGSDPRALWVEAMRFLGEYIELQEETRIYTPREGEAQSGGVQANVACGRFLMGCSGLYCSRVVGDFKRISGDCKSGGYGLRSMSER